jgi:hypothetical protein
MPESGFQVILLTLATGLVRLLERRRKNSMFREPRPAFVLPLAERR